MKNLKTQNQNPEPQQKEDYGESLSLSFLGVREVAFYLRVRPSTIYAMVERKGIPHYKVGRLVRFKKFEIDEWMEGQREAVVDVRMESKEVLRSIAKKSDLNVDRIVKKVVEQSKKKRYNFPQEKPGGIKGLETEVNHGLV